MAIEKKLDDNYRDYCFNRNELEILLGFDLDINELPDLKNQIELITNLPDELKPFLSRKTIQLKEAANIMAGYNPFHWSNKSKYCDDVQGYQASLWDAVDNNILSSKNVITHEDFGQEWRDDITLNKNEVTKWAKKYNFNWPLPIDDDIEEPNQENNDLLQRINQLEQELAEQKKINSDIVTIPGYELVEQDKQSLQDNLVDDLKDEYRRLENDFMELNDQLGDAKKEIEELNQFIQSNNITELTEEYLKSRERNNYHSLVGGLLYLLLKNSEKSLNQNTVILSLQEKFQGEPFSERSLQDKFACAKRQLLSNHPGIKFD